MPFSSTLRALQANHSRRIHWGIGLAGLLLLAWLSWFVFAEITLMAVSNTVRIEAHQATHPVQSPLAGRIVADHLTLGKAVEAGDLLLVLDTEKTQLALADQESRLTALSSQLDALKTEIEAEEQALSDDAEAGAAGYAAARAAYREKQAAAKQAGTEAVRAKTLYEKDLIAKAVYQQAEAEAEQKNAAVEAAEMQLRQLIKKQQAGQSNQQAEINRLTGEYTQLEGMITAVQHEIRRLEKEIERAHIRAPISGVLGEISTELQPGAFVTAGTPVAAVVPAGDLQAVAAFDPDVSLGKIMPGQTAKLRLEGFPWAQYGMVRATVARVGSEIRDGKVQVAFSVEPASAPRISLQHGLPGSVEVTLERVSPAILLLRTAGKFLQDGQEL